MFQWNRGGWFGSQIGATLWLVLLGVLVLARSETLGIVFVLLGLLPNFVGLWLWRRRATWLPYPAIQWLIGTCGVSAALAMAALAASDLTALSLQVPTPWFLAMYPGLMLCFHLRERSVRTAPPADTP